MNRLGPRESFLAPRLRNAKTFKTIDERERCHS